MYDTGCNIVSFGFADLCTGAEVSDTTKMLYVLQPAQKISKELLLFIIILAK
jgi:hypothetical protein